MYDLCKDVDFDHRFMNPFQKKLREDKASIENENKVFVAADKTTNYYKANKNNYDEVMNKNITKTYKKSRPVKVKRVIRIRKWHV